MSQEKQFNEMDNQNASADNNAASEKKAKADKVSTKKKSDDKPSFFEKIAKWFKGLKSEFKKVTWASRESTFKNFGIVLTIVIISAVVISAVDIGLGAFFNFLLKIIDVTPN